MSPFAKVNGWGSGISSNFSVHASLKYNALTINKAISPGTKSEIQLQNKYIIKIPV